MLKKLLLLVCALILVSGVFADISVVTENNKTTYKQGEVYDLGTAQKGETVIVNISSDPNYQEIQAEWTQLQIVPESLPEGWTFANSPENKKVLSAHVTISPTAKPAEYYEFKVKAENSSNLLESETLRIRVKVDKGLLRIELPETVKTLEQGSKTEFKMTLTNSSIAPHTVKVQTDLPQNWFEEQLVTVEPGEKK
ncbi:MAG: hypothetical protein Q7K42_01505, partial [Candidatus Diapherotrites archaeon]|nr:hypothetical protein [Candidatus Diapherotrites archaeon]